MSCRSCTWELKSIFHYTGISYTRTPNLGKPWSLSPLIIFIGQTCFCVRCNLHGISRNPVFVRDGLRDHRVHEGVELLVLALRRSIFDIEISLLQFLRHTRGITEDILLRCRDAGLVIRRQSAVELDLFQCRGRLCPSCSWALQHRRFLHHSLWSHAGRKSNRNARNLCQHAGATR